MTGEPHSSDKRQTDSGWSRRRRIGAYVSLAAVALLARTWGGLGIYPPYAVSDELGVVISARQVRLDAPRSWWQHWDTGLMYSFLVPVRASQLVFGDNLEGSRMTHVFFGTLTVIAVFGFGRRLIGDFGAWCAALLLATSHVHVHFSRTLATAGTQGAAAFALVMWGLSRSRDPGSGVGTWILTGLALGWGVQTYQLATVYPVLLICTVWAWRRDFSTPRWWLMLFVIFTCAAPLSYGWLSWLLRHYPASTDHVSNLSIFSPGFRERAGPEYWTLVQANVQKGLTMFWRGIDHTDNYAARIPVLDPVTGALFAAGIAYAAWNWRTAASRFVAIWFPPLMMGAVLVVVTEPTYHRLSAPLICVFLVSGWVLADVARRLLPRKIAAGAVVIVLAVASYLNLHYTFVEYPEGARSQTTSQALLTIRRMCKEPVLSAEDRAFLLAPDRGYWIQLLAAQCPALELTLWRKEEEQLAGACGDSCAPAVVSPTDKWQSERE